MKEGDEMRQVVEMRDVNQMAQIMLFAKLLAFLPFEAKNLNEGNINLIEHNKC